MPIETATIVPLHNKAAKTDFLFKERIAITAPGHYMIQMTAPRSGESEKYIPAARRLLAESFKDTGDVKVDMIRALIPHLLDYVPEYTRVALARTESADPYNLPTVTFALTDGQYIHVGRPYRDGGIYGTPADRTSSLSLSKPAHVGTSGPRRIEDAPPRTIRSIDAEFASQTVPGFDTDRFKPVAEILATLLAATAAMRENILDFTTTPGITGMASDLKRIRKLEL